jgi:Flp pilus assembly protein CpaB
MNGDMRSPGWVPVAHPSAGRANTSRANAARGPAPAWPGIDLARPDTGFDARFDGRPDHRRPTPGRTQARPKRTVPLAVGSRLAAMLALGGAPRLGSGLRRSLRLRVGRHRRSLGVVLVLVLTWVTIRSAVPDRPAQVSVLVAAHDLAAGRALSEADVRAASWPADGAPAGRLLSAGGRVLASPIRAGEPLTDARVLGPGLLTGLPTGTVAVPLRLSDPAAGRIVQAGDRVDVLTAPGSSVTASPTGSPAGVVAPSTQRLATDALVLAAAGGAGSVADQAASQTGALGELGGVGGIGGLAGPGATGGGYGSSTGASGAEETSGLLVLAVTSAEADRLAAAQPEAYLGIAVLGRP